MEYQPFPQIVGPTYTLDSLNAACQRCVNMMVEGIDNDPAGNNFYLRETPGTLEFATIFSSLGTADGVIGTHIDYMHTCGNGRVFCSSGSTIFELFKDGTYTQIDFFGNNFSQIGRIRITSNNSGVFFITDNLITGNIGGIGKALGNLPFTYDHIVGGSTAGFLGLGFLVCLDNYLITIVMDNVTGLLTNQFQISPNPYGAVVVNPQEPWDAAKVFSAEASSDPINGLIVNGSELWVFGPASYEVWHNPGITLSSFERISGAAYPIGCAAPWSLQSFQGSVYWLGSSNEGYGIVWQSQGLQAKRISTTPIEKLIQSIANISDATSWVYQVPGHSCYVLNFPSGKATYVFDLQTGVWHELSHRDLNANIDYQHLGTCSTFAFNKNLISDFRSNKIHEYKLDQYSDNGTPIVRYRRAPVVNAGQRRLSFHRLELNMQVGVGSGRALPGVFPNYVEDWFNANVNWIYDGDYGFFAHTFECTVDGSSATAEFSPSVDTMAYPVVIGDGYSLFLKNTFITDVFSTAGALNTAFNTIYFSVDGTLSQDYVIAYLSYLGVSSYGYAIEITGSRAGVPFDDTYPLPGTFSMGRIFQVDFEITSTGITCTVDNTQIATYTGFTFPEIGYILVDVQRTDNTREGRINTTSISSNNPGPILYGTDYDPVISIRWSDDNGYTWSNYHNVRLGKMGEFKNTVQVNRLGSAKYRVFEVYCDAAVPLRIISAELGIEAWKH